MPGPEKHAQSLVLFHVHSLTLVIYAHVIITSQKNERVHYIYITCSNFFQVEKKEAMFELGCLN